jgi:hypothetical protein
LTIVLTGISAPDRVWAFVRGITPSTPAGDGHRLLAQRLDDGERVLWSAHPVSHWRSWLPSSGRAALSLVLGLSLVGVAVGTARNAIHSLRTVIEAGLSPGSVAFIALAAALTLSVALLGSAAVAILYVNVIRPAWLDRETRYLVTDRRVLIQRGQEELHLDRERIVDVIDAPANGGKTHLFLVLDGPRARAFAPSGAFGEENGGGLQPVLKLIEDAEAVTKILKSPPRDELRAAA